MVLGALSNDAVKCQNYVASSTDEYDGKPEILGEPHRIVPICSPQILYELTLDRTTAWSVRSQQTNLQTHDMEVHAKTQ